MRIGEDAHPVEAMLEHLRQHRIVRRLVAPPGAAMDENIDRRVRPRAAVDVELLDLARPIRHPLRRADERAHLAARRFHRLVRRPALPILPAPLVIFRSTVLINTAQDLHRCWV